MLLRLCLVLGLAAPPPAAALHVAKAPDTPAEAEDPAVAAGRLFRQERFAEAAAAFAEAYAATGDPAFLFGQAQALRRGGNCPAAIEVFEAFIDTAPPEPDVREAERVITACREILDSGPAAEPEPEPEPSDTIADPVGPAPDDTTPDRTPWHRDMLGGVLLGTGLAATVAGAALYGSAFVRARDRDAPESESMYEARRRAVRSLTISGATLLGVGGALLVGSVVRYVVVSRRTERSTARVRVDSALRLRF